MRLTLPQTKRLEAASDDFLQWPMYHDDKHVFVDKIVLGGPALAVLAKVELEEGATCRRVFSATAAQLSALYGVPGAARVEVPVEFFNATRGHSFVLHVWTIAEEKPPTDRLLVASDILQQQGLVLEDRELAALVRPKWPVELHASLEVLVGEAARVRMGDGALKIPKDR